MLPKFSFRRDLGNIILAYRIWRAIYSLRCSHNSSINFTWCSSSALTQSPFFASLSIFFLLFSFPLSLSLFLSLWMFTKIVFCHILFDIHDAFVLLACSVHVRYNVYRTHIISNKQVVKRCSIREQQHLSSCSFGSAFAKLFAERVYFHGNIIYIEQRLRFN